MNEDQYRDLIERLDAIRHQNNLILLALQQVGVCSVVWDDDGNAVGLNMAVKAPTIVAGVAQS